jgi:hypothetical protein
MKKLFERFIFSIWVKVRFCPNKTIVVNQCDFHIHDAPPLFVRPLIVFFYALDIPAFQNTVRIVILSSLMVKPISIT